MSAGEGNCTAVFGGTVKCGGPTMAETGPATSGDNWYCHGLVGVGGARSRVSLQALRSAHPITTRHRNLAQFPNILHPHRARDASEAQKFRPSRLADRRTQTPADHAEANAFHPL